MSAIVGTPYPRLGVILVLAGGVLAILTGVIDLLALAYGSALGVFDDYEAIVVSAFANFIEGIAAAGIFVGLILVLGAGFARRTPARHRRRGATVSAVSVASLVGWALALYYFGDVATAILSPAKLAAGTAGFIVGPLVGLVGGILIVRWRGENDLHPRESGPSQPERAHGD
jgi:hypothetical protein